METSIDSLFAYPKIIGMNFVNKNKLMLQTGTGKEW